MSLKSVGGADPGRDPKRGEGQHAVSYLVRFWLEPREEEGETAPFRGYARDLRTGEEQYFEDPSKLAETILLRLRSERQEEGAGTDTPEAGGAVG